MTTYPSEARTHNQTSIPFALSEEQLRQFLAQGFLRLQSSLSPDYHQRIFAALHAAQTSTGHFGNNLLPLIPELHEFLSDAAVTAPLTSVLGDAYVLHPHRALHANPSGSEEQTFHKDSYWGYTRRVRNHRPWWVMLMYFPQGTPVAMGPTGALEGSQYGLQPPNGTYQPFAEDGDAGSFLLIHYDIWHRKMLNTTDSHRYMLKFQFTRLLPPMPTKQCDTASVRPWRRPRQRPAVDLNAVWHSQWNWLHGQKEPLRIDAQATPANLFVKLAHEEETVGLSAAYQLGERARVKGRNVSNDALHHLLNGLGSNPEPNDNTKRYADDGKRWRDDVIARHCAHALVQVGELALSGLCEAVAASNPRGRKHAAFALGEIGSSKAHPALSQALQDEDVHVRIAAAEALGLSGPTRKSVEALIDALQDTESEVRFSAALSLVRLAAWRKKRLIKPAVAPLAAALTDSNRYVSAYAAQALEIIGTQEALSALVPHLSASRWCGQTNNQRPF